eukprot:13570986-Ditylum_brightwellii.AAC.1
MAKIRYTCWKWWHSPASHGKSIRTVTAYEICMDCAAGKPVPAWEVDDPMSYCEFHFCIGDQMATHDPKMDIIKKVAYQKM